MKDNKYPWKIESEAQIGNLKRVKPFNDDMIPEGAVGFVYLMNYKSSDGKFYSYIGKKNFYSKRKKKFGKKALAAMTDKRAKK